MANRVHFLRNHLDNEKKFGYIGFRSKLQLSVSTQIINSDEELLLDGADNLSIIVQMA